MSIWNDCAKFNALPFRGFPAIPKIEYSAVFVLELPLGYNGSEFNNVQTLAEEIKEKIGVAVFKASDNRIEVLLDWDKVTNLLFETVRS